MKTKLILTTISLLFLSLLIKAQQTHDYVYILYNASTYEMSISINGTDYKTERINLPYKLRNMDNANPFLNKVKEYEANGWEVMTLDTKFAMASERYIAYLRKKSPEQK